MRHFPVRLPSLRTAALFLALAAGMAVMNFALPQREPAAFLLMWAAFAVLRVRLAASAAYLAASAVFLSWQATVCCLAQAAMLLIAYGVCGRLKKDPGVWRITFAALAQIPFVFLFPHAGYALFPLPVHAQKAVIAAFFLLASALAEGGLRAAMRANKCRLTGAQLAEAAFLWLIFGMGICNALGGLVYTGIALLGVLLAVALLENAVPVPFSVVLSLPLCVCEVSVLPLALFAVYACCALLVASYGRIASSLALSLAYLAAQYFAGVYALSAAQIVLHLLACILPAALVCVLPGKLLEKIRESLLFYRERVLPRIAVNRNRRAVGERLYEVAALFREIENAFLLPDREDDGERRITLRLESSVCAACPRRKACDREQSAQNLVRLVRVGRAKGKANLIDLPAELARNCPNVAGILFALNKELEEDCRRKAALETAREGRILLARQAHKVGARRLDLHAHLPAADENGPALRIAVEEGREGLFHAERGTAAVHVAGERKQLLEREHVHRLFPCRPRRLFQIELRGHGYDEHIVSARTSDGDERLIDASRILPQRRRHGNAGERSALIRMYQIGRLCAVKNAHGVRLFLRHKLLLFRAGMHARPQKRALRRALVHITST